MNVEKATHYADLFFQKFIYDHFGINKGVLNTIDISLYELGFTNIIKRRRTIILFLMNIKNDLYKEGIGIIFGRGELTNRLESFLIEEEVI